jgi:hypothetical protein
LAPELKNTKIKTVEGIIRTLILIFISSAVLSLAASCGGKGRPEGILSKAEMVQMLEEMYLAEEKINRLGIARDSAKEVFQAMRKEVFENTTATDSVFQRSFDYYMEHPKEMELIYTALVDTLQLKEQRAPFLYE